MVGGDPDTPAEVSQYCGMCQRVLSLDETTGMNLFECHREQEILD